VCPVYQSCAAGKYTSGSSCTNCAVGKYSAASGAGGCITCTSGKYAAAAATTCSPCSAGQYTAAAGVAQCTACATGYFQANTGAVSCTLCYTGSYCSATTTTTCPQGYYCPAGSSTANKCPAGTFQALTSQASAQPVPRECSIVACPTTPALHAPLDRTVAPPPPPPALKATTARLARPQQTSAPQECTGLLTACRFAQVVQWGGSRVGYRTTHVSFALEASIRTQRAAPSA